MYEGRGSTAPRGAIPAAGVNPGSPGRCLDWAPRTRFPAMRPTRSVLRLFAVAACTLVVLSGCDMLGSLFETRMLRGIVVVVVVVAAVGFLVSRAAPRR